MVKRRMDPPVKPEGDEEGGSFCVIARHLPSRVQAVAGIHLEAIHWHYCYAALDYPDKSGHDTEGIKLTPHCSILRYPTPSLRQQAAIHLEAFYPHMAAQVVTLLWIPATNRVMTR